MFFQLKVVFVLRNRIYIVYLDKVLGVVYFKYRYAIAQWVWFWRHFSLFEDIKVLFPSLLVLNVVYCSPFRSNLCLLGT